MKGCSMDGRNDILAIRLDELALIATYVVYMHLVEAQCEEVLNMTTMLIQVG
jgi:hypothetical protein